MDRKKKYIPAIIILVLLILSILYFDVFRKLRGDAGRIEGSGTIEATEIDVGSKIAGRVVYLSKDEGENVEKGEIIAKLEYEEMDAQRLAVLASLNNARSNLRRIEKLYKAGSVSQKDYDQVITAFRVADANYSLISASIQNAIIPSPIEGIVLARNCEIGEMAFPGAPIITVADLTKVWIKIYVTETDLGHVRHGQKAEVFIDSFPDKAFTGKVVSISNRAEFTPKTIQTKDERTKLMFAVKITVANPDMILKPGMPADAYIITENKQ